MTGNATSPTIVENNADSTELPWSEMLEEHRPGPEFDGLFVYLRQIRQELKANNEFHEKLIPLTVMLPELQALCRRERLAQDLDEKLGKWLPRTVSLLAIAGILGGFSYFLVHLIDHLNPK